MKDAVKNLKSKLKKAEQSFDYVSRAIEIALSNKLVLSYNAKHYLFQYQVLLESNGHLLKKYKELIAELQEYEISEEQYEYVCRVLNNLIADHQAKAISIDNILRKEK